LPFVLIRSAIATFLARGDTATPLKAALIAAAVNIGFKLVLTPPLAQVGLALATTIGAWINFGLVIFFASRRGLVGLDPRLTRSILKLAAAGIVLAAALWLAKAPVLAAFADWPRFGAPAALALLAAIGALLYGAALALLFGSEIRSRWTGRRSEEVDE
jgi:putative peptidoglycan lipid II flippase